MHTWEGGWGGLQTQWTIMISISPRFSGLRQLFVFCLLNPFHWGTAGGGGGSTPQLRCGEYIARPCRVWVAGKLQHKEYTTRWLQEDGASSCQRKSFVWGCLQHTTPRAKALSDHADFCSLLSVHVTSVLFRGPWQAGPRVPYPKP